MHDVVEKAEAPSPKAPAPRVHRTPAIAPAPVRIGEGDRAILIRPLAPHARLALRLRPAEAARIGALAGLALDGPINSLVADEARSLMRLGPDEWLLRAQGEDPAALAREAAAALGGSFHALVDVSHRNTGFAVEGPRVADVLNAGCPLDLAASAFPVAKATRTILGKAEILLARTDEARFEVECWRSFAQYVHAFLAGAARDVR